MTMLQYLKPPSIDLSPPPTGIQTATKIAEYNEFKVLRELDTGLLENALSSLATIPSGQATAYFERSPGLDTTSTFNIPPLLAEIVERMFREDTEIFDIDDDTANAPVSQVESNWVSQHLDQLQEQYGGQWIIVVGTEVVAHAERLPDAGKEAEKQRIVDPFVEYIPPKSDEPPPIVIL